jgi:pimeloyl-ACP methyl ester carboxylesterase
MTPQATSPSARAGTWLLVRGLTRETGHWGRFLEIFQAQLAPAAVVAADLPGCGRRWRDRSPLSIGALTDALRQDADRLARPLRVLGLSMGGMVALDWAQRHPGELAGVVMVNSSARPHATLRQRLNPGAWWSLLRVLAGGDADAVERAILQQTSAWPRVHAGVLDGWADLRRRHPVSRANALRQLVAAARFRAAATPPAVPVLLMCAAADALVDPACSHAMARAWGLPLAEHPSAGHDLPLDDPVWVARRCLAWGGEDAAISPRPAASASQGCLPPAGP